MGLLKSLKKIGKNILSGVKKVFKKVGSAVKRVVSSDWGRSILTAGSVVLGGLALYGGVQGAASAGAGTSFLDKFAAGAKGALSAITSPVETAKQALGGGAPAGNASVPQNAQEVLSQPQQAAEGVQQAAAAGGPAAAQPSSGGGIMGQIGGAAKKIGGGLLDYAKSDSGQKVISGVIQGYAEGKQAEDQRNWEQKQARYYDNAWADPSRTAGLQQQAAATPRNAPPGYLDRARRISQFLQERQFPSGEVPSPETVAGYAVGQ